MNGLPGSEGIFSIQSEIVLGGFILSFLLTSAI